MRILSVSHSVESLFSDYFSLSHSFCFSLSLLASHPLSGSPSTSRTKRTTPALALMRKLRSFRRAIQFARRKENSRLLTKERKA